MKKLVLSLMTATALTLIPAAAMAAPAQTIVLAGGCFWGMESVFEHVKGVQNTTPGYAGGEASTAEYEKVAGGNTGHAESVQVTYDPDVIPLAQLLDIYFIAAHNPTELNYQGPDHGTQYRSSIFYATPEQKQEAESVMAQLKKDNAYSAPIVTTLEPLKQFYPAEAYHMHYADLHPHEPYIMFHDAPLIDAVKKHFPEFYVEKRS